MDDDDDEIMPCPAFCGRVAFCVWGEGTSNKQMMSRE
jgi:hypothetical protein